MARASPASSIPVISGMVWSVMMTSNCEGSSLKRARAALLLAASDLIAKLLQDIRAHFNKKLFVVDEKDALMAGCGGCPFDTVCRGLFRYFRKEDRESGAFPQPALHHNPTVELADDPMDDRQAETRSFPFFLVVKKGSNIFSISSSGMPSPVSLTTSLT